MALPSCIGAQKMGVAGGKAVSIKVGKKCPKCASYVRFCPFKDTMLSLCLNSTTNLVRSILKVKRAIINNIVALVILYPQEVG